jgi:DNA-directed RNA polymerase sigma subunit (sigma70/sigma32)
VDNRNWDGLKHALSDFNADRSFLAQGIDEKLAVQFEQLPELDRNVLAARFGLDAPRVSLAEIAGWRSDLNPNRVRLVETRALEALSNALD